MNDSMPNLACAGLKSSLTRVPGPVLSHHHPHLGTRLTTSSSRPSQDLLATCPVSGPSPQVQHDPVAAVDGRRASWLAAKALDTLTG